ncbi:hypothetical protein ACJJTC_014471 [Scirpophaga incertulas]
MEKNLKHQIVKSAAAVKRKVEMIKDARNSNNMALGTIFKPIVDPLNLLANKHEKQQEHENQFEPFVKKIKKDDNDTFSSCSGEFNEVFSDEESNSDSNLYENKTLTAPQPKVETSPTILLEDLEHFVAQEMVSAAHRVTVDFVTSENNNKNIRKYI